MKLKYCFILFFAASWLSQVSAQLDFDAVEKQRMARARVRTQTEWVHDYVNGRPAPRGYRSAVTRYDTRGNIVEIINYNEAGRVLSSNVFQYNSADNRVNFEQFDADRKLRYSQKAVYDSRGNKTREFGFDGAKPYNNIFTYDANGRLIEITYTEEEIVVERRRMTYSGNRTEISVLNPSGSLMFRIVNTHNDRGQLLSEVRTNAQGVVAYSLTMQYNAAGNLTQEERKRENDRLDYRRIYTYDRENRQTRIEVVSQDGTRFVANEYQYSPIGDLIMESSRRNERATEPSTRRITYNARGVYTEVDRYFATYRLNSQYRYEYEFF